MVVQFRIFLLWCACHKFLILNIEILRVSKSGENRDNEGGEPSQKKTKYKSYTGAVVTEDTVKLSEKVIVPVKEYPKVWEIAILCRYYEI